jgi:DNA-binding beta-propeller fold protein YncE
MRFRRVIGLAAMAVATVLWMSCGQIYRPVVIPINNIPPNPEDFHAIFSINNNTPFNYGTGMQIDVSGDTEIGAANMGVNPTHAGILPNDSRVFVANAGSQNGTDADSITAFFPAADSRTATGIGAPTVFSLPTVGPTNPATEQPSFYCPYLPVYVTTAQNSAVFVANYGTENVSTCSISSTDSVAILNPLTNTIAQVSYLPAATHPVAMAETPNGLNLYVANQGNNTVTNLSPIDLTTQAIIPVGSEPTWMVSRVDGLRVYVVTQGDGNLWTINTATNAVMSTQSVGGAGANYVLYDNSLNRLYVTNPNAGAVYVFDATVDPPNPLATVSIAAPPPCAASPGACSAAAPVSVAALPDTTRFYVASYATSTAGVPCPDPTVTAAQCIIPQVTVYDANTFAVKTTIFPLLSTTSTFTTTNFALTPVPFCSPNVPYTPAATRFRMSAAASADSSRVYAGMCDAGQVAVITTTANDIAVNGNAPDTLVTDLAAPFSAGPPQANGEPLPQNPVFLLTGQ